MDVKIIPSGTNDKNESLYLLIVDYSSDAVAIKLTERELNSLRKKLWTQVDTLKK